MQAGVAARERAGGGIDDVAMQVGRHFAAAEALHGIGAIGAQAPGFDRIGERNAKP